MFSRLLLCGKASGLFLDRKGTRWCRFINPALSAFTTLETFTAGYILYSYFVSFLYSYGLYPNPESLEAVCLLGRHGYCPAV
jgi:hypothetical protein